MRKTSFALGVFSLTMLFACTKEIRNNDSLQAEEAGNSSRSDNPIALAATDPYVSNEVLVKFKKGVAAQGQANALNRISGKVKEKVLTKMMERVGDDGFFVVHTPLAVLDAVGKMKGVEGIEYVEPNYIYTYGADSNDPYYTNGSLWGLYGEASSPANQYGSQAAEAWTAGYTGAANVIVGVIDEGIQVSHPDLDANVWVNPFDKADGVDNDGNGYADDINGWDFDGNNNSVYDGGSRGSLDDHGTHVAGTIGAERNGSGVVGVNWAVKMISCKFLGRRGGTTANAVKAVDYLNDLKTRHGLNIVASNNSWGGGGFSQALYDAIERANAKNILFVAAAGNGGSDGVGDNNDVTPHYPSSYANANIIAVASITSSGARSSFSNFGATSVDIGAPGSGINSTTAFNTYSSYSGTSMATPHVTGAVALYAATKGVYNNASQIKNAILTSAISTTSLSTTTPVLTKGRLDANGALAY